LAPAGDGFLELREFLSLCSVLQRGSALDKLKVVFDAWDADRSGHLSADEVETMLRATITLEEGAAKEVAVHSMTQRAFRRISCTDLAAGFGPEGTTGHRCVDCECFAVQPMPW